MPIRQYAIPETIVSLWRIDRAGDQCDTTDCVAGIELRPDGRLQIDLRNMRPIRVNDRDGLIIELDVNEVMNAIAEGIREAVKDR